MQEVLMPWMPEVFTAPIAEARRAQGNAEANDAVPYYEGIMADEPDALIRSFAGQPVLDEPRVGHVEGARGSQDFVAEMTNWLRVHDAVVENVALNRTLVRTVEEVVLHLLGHDGTRVELPVAIVTERSPERTLKAIRVYHSMWPLTASHYVRPPLLPEDPRLHPEGAPGDYQRALAEGDLEGIVATFESDGYAREPSGGRTCTVAPRVCEGCTCTCWPTGAAFHWSTAPSPTTACGVPSSTTACDGE